MITQKLINRARELAGVGPSQYQTPPQELVYLASRKALELAEKLQADRNVVEVGSLLMDCELGLATKEGKGSQHIEMSVVTTKNLLDEFPEVSVEDRDSILACVTEHHGAKQFTSLESEICCNADCYKFASVEGFVLTLRFMRPMAIDDQIKILRDKLEEKWSALTLEDCKTELKPQYETIKRLLEQLKI